MVARLVRDQEVVGSSPVASTKKIQYIADVLYFFIVFVMSFVENADYRGFMRGATANDSWK